MKQQSEVALALEQKIWQQVGLVPGMKILDLGCGSGVISCTMANYVSPGEVLGVDMSHSMIEQAQQFKQSNHLSNISFQVGNAYELDFPDATFDFIYSRLLFQHLVEPMKVVTNLARILKPGGTLCVLNVDDGWLTVYPEPASFAAFYNSIVIAQRARGGDPYVGRKLGRYFYQAGLTDVKMDVEVLSSDMLGLKTLLNMSFNAPYDFPRLDLAEIATQGKQDLSAFLDLPNAWAALGVFIATGRKPI